MLTTEFSPRTRRGVRRALVSVATTATAAFLAFGLAAAPASADTGVDARYTGNIASGHQLKFEDGTVVGTTLFKLTFSDGSTIPAYCIDLETAIRTNADYVEDDWSNYPGEGEFASSQPGKVLWILQNSYPTVSAEELAEKAGIPDLTEKDALSATQAAIWHYSNGADLKQDGNPEAVWKLYKYLVDNATEIQQAPASLTITPNEASGESGGSIGEFTVSTTADSVPLTLDGPDGVKTVDLDGNPVSEVGNGDKFAVLVPEGTPDGEATVSASVTATVEIGRLFRGLEGTPKTQTLISAGKTSTEASAEVKVTWTAPKPSETPSPSPSVPEESPTPTPSPSDSPSPTPPAESPKPTPPANRPGLPVTGAALGGLIAAAVVAVGGGGAAMYLARKRRSGADDA
nr:thioester domain-containing protein [Thermobifida cellulosilytica]